MIFLWLVSIISFLSSTEVTFKVDMSNADGWLNGNPPSCGSPTISGTFFEWNEYQNLIEISNNIWGITLELEPGDFHEYKFANCGWNFEIIPESSSCTVSFFGSTNRYVNIPSSDIELEPVLFGTCDLSNGTPYWQLVWSDEFDQPNIDLSKWSYDIGVGNWGWGNNEAQYYTSNSNNSFIENGKLVIKANNNNFGTQNYTSARLKTKNKGDWTYGKFVIRAKLPAGRGTWPAIWMLPTSNIYGGWPYSGEIDIMEAVGHDYGIIHGTVHSETYNWNFGIPPSSGEIFVDDFNSEFHDYIIEWDEYGIRWFIDDIQYHSYPNYNQGSSVWPFDQNFHLILNIAIGGTWGGQEGIDNSIFPVQMEVDYVRVYQHVNQPETQNVTFLVDMQNEIVSESGIYLVGSDDHSNNEFGDGIQMTNLGVGNDIWSVVVPLSPGVYTYGYRNGDSAEDLINLINCDSINSNMRVILVENENLTVGPHCYGSCTACYNLNVKDNIEQISSFILDNIYPNPFNPDLNLSFSIYEKTKIEIIIYDINGEKLEIIQEGFFEVGTHDIKWKADTYSSGIYFVNFFDGRNHTTKKIMLLK